MGQRRHRNRSKVVHFASGVAWEGQGRAGQGKRRGSERGGKGREGFGSAQEVQIGVCAANILLDLCQDRLVGEQFPPLTRTVRCKTTRTAATIGSIRQPEAVKATQPEAVRATFNIRVSSASTVRGASVLAPLGNG